MNSLRVFKRVNKQAGRSAAVGVTALLFLLHSSWVGSALPTGRYWPEAGFHISTGDLTATSVGASDWEAAFNTAAQRWNAVVPFEITTDSSTQLQSCSPNEPNTAFFSAQSCGNAWGTNVVGVSSTWASSHSKAAFQTSIAFNSTKTWSVYDGPLNGSTIDFTRVAVHEIGHSIGLGHTARAGAIMTPSTSSTTDPQVDDKAGVEAIYGTAGMAFVSDSNGSGGAELGVVRARLADQRARVQTREVNNGALANTRYYSKDFAPLGIHAVEDTNADNDPEIAVVHKRISDGRAHVEVREAQDGALLNTFFFSAGATPMFSLGLQSNNNGSTDVAAIMIRNSDERIWVQVRDSADGALLANMYFPFNTWPKAAVAVPDINGNGADEIAILLVDRSTLRLQLQLRDSATGGLVTNGFQPPNYEGHGLAVLQDINGNGAADLASLVERDDGRLAVRVQDGETGATLKLMFLLSNTSLLVPSPVAGLTDLSGNSLDEVAVLLQRNADNRSLIQIRDASTGNLVRNIYLGSKFVPQSVISVPSINGGSAQEVAVLGFDVNGIAKAVIYDSGTGVKIRTMTFAIP